VETFVWKSKETNKLRKENVAKKQIAN